MQGTAMSLWGPRTPHGEYILQGQTKKQAMNVVNY